MRITYITAGAGGMYCGSCIRDNALAAGLTAAGHEVLLLPLYTPLLTDEENVSSDRLFYDGISVYLEEWVPLFRHTPWLLDRLWESPQLIRAVAGRAVQTEPESLGDLTVSVLEGTNGRQSQGDRQAGALAPRTAEAGRRGHLELDADRAGAAAQGGARRAGLLHAAGRGHLSQPSGQGASRPLHRVDCGTCEVRRPFRRGQRLLRRADVPLPRHSGREDRRRPARYQRGGAGRASRGGQRATD